VKNQLYPINSEKKKDLYKYIEEIITEENQKLISINGSFDHIHLFISLKPEMKLSDLVRTVKSKSSKFINENNWTNGKFGWQKGYGAFSYSYSQIPEIINYIETQEEEHNKKSFKDEYIELLNKFNIGYDENYLFEWI
jgi:REP element-mobilizing transposase RayT